MTRPVRLLLVGMMGAGKTTVGTALARRTGWPYLDNDELVRRAAGRGAPELLDRAGVGALRTAEHAALLEALRTPPPVVAGVAAGVVDDPVDRDRLRAGGFVVWLRAGLDVLAARVGSGTGRPWLGADPAAALRRLGAGRDARFAAAAHLVVDVDDRTPDEAVDVILDGLAAAAPPG